MNPQHQPTTGQRRQVNAMAACGIPQLDIARTIGISDRTLRKHYRDELDLGHVKATAQVAGFLFNAAKSGNVTAQIFWLKTRAGWSEYAAALEPDLTSPFGRVLARRAERQH